MGSCAGEKRGERMGKVGREIREGEMEETTHRFSVMILDMA